MRRIAVPLAQSLFLPGREHEYSSGRRTLKGGVLLRGHSYYAFSLQVINAKDIKDSVMPIGYILISLRIVILLVQYFVYYHECYHWKDAYLVCFTILQLFTHRGLSILWFHIYAHYYVSSSSFISE